MHRFLSPSSRSSSSSSSSPPPSPSSSLPSSSFFLNALPYTERGAACELPAIALRDLARSVAGDGLRYAVLSNMLWNGAFVDAELGSHLRTSRGGGLLVAATASHVEPLARALGQDYVAAAPNDVPSYGSMHSKFALLFYERTLRVAVVSNNFCSRDFERKTG